MTKVALITGITPSIFMPEVVQLIVHAYPIKKLPDYSNIYVPLYICILCFDLKKIVFYIHATFPWLFLSGIRWFGICKDILEN